MEDFDGTLQNPTSIAQGEEYMVDFGLKGGSAPQKFPAVDAVQEPGVTEDQVVGREPLSPELLETEP